MPYSSASQEAKMMVRFGRQPSFNKTPSVLASSSYAQPSVLKYMKARKRGFSFGE
jgi:hypothetical protein